MKKSNGKFILFMKKNALWLILSLCIVAVGLSVTLMMLTSDNAVTQIESPVDTDDRKDQPEPGDNNDKDDDKGGEVIVPGESDEEPVETVIVFDMPVKDAASVSRYSETMVFNSTLSRYTVHLAIDFFAPEGTDVFAAYDGVIESVTNDVLTGYTVTIDHGNGLKSIYNSLADGDCVVTGQKVAKGDVIGQVSVTNRQEYKSGAHLHFEVMENNALIDPATYLIFDEK